MFSSPTIVPPGPIKDRNFQTCPSELSDLRCYSPFAVPKLLNLPDSLDLDDKLDQYSSIWDMYDTVGPEDSSCDLPTLVTLPGVNSLGSDSAGSLDGSHFSLECQNDLIADEYNDSTPSLQSE